MTYLSPIIQLTAPTSLPIQMTSVKPERKYPISQTGKIQDTPLIILQEN